MGLSDSAYALGVKLNKREEGDYIIIESSLAKRDSDQRNLKCYAQRQGGEVKVECLNAFYYATQVPTYLIKATLIKRGDIPLKKRGRKKGGKNKPKG